MRVGWMEKRGHNVCGRPRLWKPGLPCARRGRPPRCPVSGPALAALRLSLRLSLRTAPKQRAAPGQLQPASRGPPPAGGWRLQPIEGDACAMRRVGDPRLAHDPPPMVLSEGANVPLTILLSALPLNTDEVTRSSPCPPIFSLHSPLLTHFSEASYISGHLSRLGTLWCADALFLFLYHRLGNGRDKEIPSPGSQSQ